ncbi:MAG TPA: signal peptidase II, partial [Ktedonobacterales bacterium]|nr:signal peptidase II [Ktedonobacterales bacterium]
MSAARRNDLIMVAVGAVVVLLDQLTKYWIVQYFSTGAPRGPVALVGNWLELLYTPNTGVAFSLFEGLGVKFLFIALALAVICV